MISTKVAARLKKKATDWYGRIGRTLEPLCISDDLAAYENFGRPVVSERKERDFFSEILCGNQPVRRVLGDDAAVLARSSGEEPASPRHRAGVASMAWRSTR